MNHALHLADVRFELLHRRIIAEQFERELHPRQRGAQIVRDAGQHLRALADLSLDSIAHYQKGDGCLADLDGAFNLEEGNRAALAEALGRRRQSAQ